MGLIRSDFGRVCIETRRESFYVHIDESDDSPEIEYAALPDLIAALCDLRDNDVRFARWRERSDDNAR